MRVVDERVVCEGRWIELRERRYVDRNGGRREWRYAARTDDRSAAVVIAHTRETRSLITVVQTRVPFGGPMLEFPAGLIEPDEDPAAAGVRELSEETGFRAEALRVLPPAASSAGLSNETIYLVWAIADETPSVDTNHSESEDIITLLTAPGEIDGLLARAANESWVLDAKLAIYLQSIMDRSSSIR